jgi:hypothetical protein
MDKKTQWDFAAETVSSVPAEMPSDEELEMIAQEPEEPPFRCCACGHNMNSECGFAYRLNPDQAVCVCCTNNEP